MNSSSHAPLVATDLEEAADLMISEGSPVRQPSSGQEEKKPCCGPLMGALQSTADRHPLLLLLGAFAAGVAGGFAIAGAWEGDE